ncbi:EamA family transporter [Nitrosomonas sp.]|uniref:EamA family transporter n=1 Tax=Nitrosomonas sp. TaxID=42353 RepID=UPI0025CCA652|nr:EamA family transporter [Nitrosomonas sp.]MCC6916350.1 EamA family transporter [Nitrosomonas sp.]
MKTFFIAILSIVFSVAAQFSLKMGISGESVKTLLAQPYSFRTFCIFLDKYVLTGFLLYGLGAIVWLSVLSKWDVSKAYPLVGLGFVFTIIVGYLLGEQISLLRVVGVVLICTGVFLVGKS